ncbi:hypothetical protein AVEN_161106-1 [Araneus ventricosus]|uniref:NYN domain-containing protein n=1 Tax=Araneus ventricosus TaxID=182803 RepID=A0A4Y2TEZ5_ARAVE|nr:hypothetical protein AVEN_161106-1 [Araneus ventricosus]
MSLFIELFIISVILFLSGVLRNTKKSTLYNIFDTVPERPVGNTDNLYFVLDGGFLIHPVVWPKQGTFDDVYTIYMSYIKKHYGDEVTVVFDVGYTESSVNTKVIERQRRMMKCTSREIIFNESTVLLDSQRLSNLANRERFISQFVSHLEKVGICTFIATNDADVHIVMTAIETYEKIKKQVLVIGQDVDLLVLPTAVILDYMDIFMLKEGKSKVKDRFYIALEICRILIL